MPVGFVKSRRGLSKSAFKPTSPSLKHLYEYPYEYFDIGLPAPEAASIRIRYGGLTRMRYEKCL
jgi:hypothetical protein